jgi:thioredoxin-like negative regulator of GroEL
MEPILEDLEKDTKDWAEIVKLDVSVEMDLAQELGVSGLPTFLVFKNGQPIGSSSGATSKANLLKMMAK